MRFRLLKKTLPRVEAYTASWIEISTLVCFFTSCSVEAYTASWIEISLDNLPYGGIKVEAYTASWIEIDEAGYRCRQK